MTPTKCGLDGCDKFVGATPYMVLGDDSRYCSRGCSQQAWEQRGKRKKPHADASAGEDDVNIPAEDFGDAGVSRKLCDDPNCRMPVTLEWRGRGGTYHSLNCLKRIERGEQMTDATIDAAVAAPTSPIAAGKVPTKKTAKASAKATKTAKAKTAPASAKKAEGDPDPFGVFRSGTAKAAIAAVLYDGKYHGLDELQKTCDKVSTGYGQIGWAVKELEERGGCSVEIKGAGAEKEFRVKKAAKKA